MYASESPYRGIYPDPLTPDLYCVQLCAQSVCSRDLLDDALGELGYLPASDVQREPVYHHLLKNRSIEVDEPQDGYVPTMLAIRYSGLGAEEVDHAMDDISEVYEYLCARLSSEPDEGLDTPEAYGLHEAGLGGLSEGATEYSGPCTYCLHPDCRPFSTTSGQL